MSVIVHPPGDVPGGSSRFDTQVIAAAADPNTDLTGNFAGREIRRST